MGRLSDLVGNYAEHVRQHTGLHYVPSFNDLNSGAPDDIEAEEMSAEMKIDTKSAPVVVSETTAAEPIPRRTSNKADESWPQFGNKMYDMHTHQVSSPHKRRDFLYDTPHNPKASPTVMEFILQSKDVRDLVGERAVSGGGDSAVIRRDDLMRATGMAKEKASAAISAVTNDGGEEMRVEQYKEFIHHHGSE